MEQQVDNNLAGKVIKSATLEQGEVVIRFTDGTAVVVQPTTYYVPPNNHIPTLEITICEDN